MAWQEGWVSIGKAIAIKDGTLPTNFTNEKESGMKVEKIAVLGAARR